MDKFREEFNRLLKKHSLIVSLLYLLDGDIDIRRQLEELNAIPFTMRRSIRVEEERSKLQVHLKEVKQDLDGMIAILIKQETDPLNKEISRLRAEVIDLRVAIDNE